MIKSNYKKMNLLRTLGNFFMLNTVFGIYMIYLAIYDNAKFQEIIFLMAHYSVKAYSYLQIYSRKAKVIYITHLYPHVSKGCNYLLEEAKKTELYQKYKSYLPWKDEENTEEENGHQEVTTQYTLEFVKDNEIVYSTTKESFLTDECIVSDFDFIIGVINENGILFQKLFYELPQREEDFEYQKIYCDVRSFALLNKVESDDEEMTALSVENELEPLSFDLVGEHYYYWIENNVFTPSFLFYFLIRYYSVSFTMDEMKNCQLQIITKEMDILTVSLDGEQEIKVLEKGFDIILQDSKEEKEEGVEEEEEKELRRSKRERKSSKSKTE